MVVENAQSIQKVMENLTALSRLDGDRRRQKNIRLPEAVSEVFRQLRELARGRYVQLRRHEELPDVEVNAAAVELCLSNYVSNAIKYSDAGKRERWVLVEAWIGTRKSNDGSGNDDGDPCELTVRVRDNGVGVPVEKREQLFERFFRAHEGMDVVEGTGLGLSLVRETVAALGGRAWAEFDQAEGSAFAFALPCRRADEAPAPHGANSTPAARAH
jgi:signal transduction histidine kinase